MLVCKGYPDIGWNPVEGERYLDFLRFAVFCNGDCRNSVKAGLIDFLVFVGVNTVMNSSALIWSGESVEENANVVVRLLIRRPECFGPALRGEGGDGLLAAMKEAIKISQDLSKDRPLPKSGIKKTL